MRTPDHRIGDRPGLGFTLIELLTVIAIIGVLAGLLVGLAPTAARKMKESRIKSELAQLILAVESYKAEVGYYPPDNPRVTSPGVTNYAVNQLFYELTGTVVTNVQVATATRYSTVNGLSTLQSSDINSAFGTPGFVNVSEDPKAVRNFLHSLRERQFKEVKLPNSPRPVLLLVVPVDLPRGVTAAPTLPAQVNPWRYNSSTPVHNPGRFDLWAEVPVWVRTNVTQFVMRTNIIGNWKD